MTAPIIYAVLSIAAFAALCIACRMAAMEDPCKGCDREYCTECEYWKDAVIGGGILPDDEGIPTQDVRREMTGDD